MEHVLHGKFERVIDVLKHNRLFTLTRFEKVTVIMLVIVLCTLAGASIYTKSGVSEMNAMIEKIQLETENIQVTNQIYQQKIEDLMTYDRINDLAVQYGMARHDNNVKAVKK